MLRMLILTGDLTIETRQYFRGFRFKSNKPFPFSSISTHLRPIPADSYSWSKPGFPRFRSFRRYDSITSPSDGDGCRLLDDEKLRIQGAGPIKVKLQRPVEGEIKTVTIKRDVNHWVVCFSVERDSVRFPESSEGIGMDVGLDSFVALSNGTEIDNPRHLKSGLAHLVRAQRRLSRRERGSHATARPPHWWPRRTVKSETSVPPFIMISAAGWWNATG